MVKVLKMNRVVIFIFLTLPWIVNYFYQYIDKSNNFFASIIWISILFIWFFMLDQELMKRIPNHIEISNTLYYTNLLLLYLSICLFYIFAEPGKTYVVTGLYIIPILYLIFALFQIFNHLSKLLTYVEEERNVEFGKRIGEIVLFSFFFIGVLWLQPRIIKVLEKPEVDQNRYIKMREGEIIEEQNKDQATEAP